MINFNCLDTAKFVKEIQIKILRNVCNNSVCAKDFNYHVDKKLQEFDDNMCYMSRWTIFLVLFLIVDLNKQASFPYSFLVLKLKK